MSFSCAEDATVFVSFPVFTIVSVSRQLQRLALTEQTYYEQQAKMWDLARKRQRYRTMTPDLTL